tara:strand:- start:3849 stop:6584 length:2736 start_codon:yes stop_codon:yes gene_type:complete
MPNEIRYYDTPHTFISPVRHFKANDPYYFEIDNIPVKQLEESQNFLKDQVDGLITRANNKAEISIDRSGFSELKPFATGNDRKVRVNPGKYTSRINNAYSLTPLQVVQQVAGFSNTRNSDGTLSDLNTYRVQTNIGGAVAAALNQFQDGLLGDALNMNGLAERTFVFPFWDEDGFHLAKGFDVSGTTTPGYGQFDADFSPDDRSLYPNFVGALLKHSTPDNTRDLVLIKNVFEAGEEPQAGQQGRLESEFIKRWRGAIRTSIVDVPEELEITVPDFDLDDFFYIDANGNREALNANQRIDLLFIYSKAVDEESTTIPKFDANGNPTTLTAPALGILKGAGIGISRQTASNNDNADDRVSLQTLDGTPIMLAHPGDENGSNNGFTTSAGVIRGSFPSPDDLMNLAPALSEQLETNAFQLIGQSILPVAYVRVQSDTGPIADIINNDDIIDIRPFFRTTELAYNERAGIAAATPQVSIANPVVTEAHLEKVRKEVYGDINDRVGAIEGALAQTNIAVGQIAGPGNSGARPIAAGQVLGGYWGPEGALMKLSKSNIAGGLRNAQFNQIVDIVESEFGYKAGSIPYLPNWDKAEWYGKGNFGGDSVCDHINMGAGLLVEPAGPDGDQKYMPPWIENRNNGQTSTVQQIRDERGFDRFSMYNWGPTDNPVYFGGGRPAVNAPGGPGTTIFGSQTPALGGEALASINRRNVQINFVRKTIKLDLTNTPWVQDYNVNVSFLNCTPLCDPTNPPSLGENQGQGITNNRNSCQIWVEKFKDYFNICVAWAGTNHLGKTTGDIFPWNNRNDPERFAGFAQVQPFLLGGSPFSRSNINAPFGYSVNYGNTSQREDFFSQQVIKPGLAPGNNVATPAFFNPLIPLLYPSVKFEVVGIAGDFLTESLGGNGAKMRTNNPTITCS